MATTTIEVSIDNYRWLNAQKYPGDSFDDVLTRLREDYDDRDEEGDQEPGDDEIAHRVRDHFDLDGGATADHVVAVAQSINEGRDLDDAIKQRADDVDVVVGTVRDACTRRLGITGDDASEQFLAEITALLNE